MSTETPDSSRKPFFFNVVRIGRHGEYCERCTNYMGVEEDKTEMNQWESGVEGGTVTDWLGVRESRGVKGVSW